MSWALPTLVKGTCIALGAKLLPAQFRAGSLCLSAASTEPTPEEIANSYVFRGMETLGTALAKVHEAWGGAERAPANICVKLVPKIVAEAPVGESFLNISAAPYLLSWLSLRHTLLRCANVVRSTGESRDFLNTFTSSLPCIALHAAFPSLSTLCTRFVIAAAAAAAPAAVAPAAIAPAAAACGAGEPAGGAAGVGGAAGECLVLSQKAQLGCSRFQTNAINFRLPMLLARSHQAPDSSLAAVPLPSFPSLRTCSFSKCWCSDGSCNC